MSADNALKNYNFAFEVNGVIQAYIQEVTSPDVEYAIHLQGNQGNLPDAKAPGKKKVGELNLKQTVPAPQGDGEIWNWFLAAQVNLRPGYARQAFLIELNNGVPVKKYYCKNIWIQKIVGVTYATAGDNSADVIRESVMQMDDFLPV